jgi:hypothetical protein
MVGARWQPGLELPKRDFSCDRGEEHFDVARFTNRTCPKGKSPNMAWYKRRYTVDVWGNFYSINGKPRVPLPKETERTLKALVKERGVDFALAAVAHAQKQIEQGPTRVTQVEVDTDELGL